MTGYAQQLAEQVGDAAVVGLGTSTRSGAETFAFVEEVTGLLLQRGFRAIAIRDNQRVGALYDQFVTGGIDSLEHVLPQAWGPWQTVEFRDALIRLRTLNQAQDDPVRVVGVGGSRVLVADYDRVLELSGNPERVRALFDVIRVAHANGEHVQRAMGVHPGTPFVELAREAEELVQGAGPEAEELAAAIVDHHARAVGAGYDAVKDDTETADRLLTWHQESGRRTVFWEGSAHVAAGYPLGARLRSRIEDDYRAVHVTFGSGVVAGARVPAPQPGSLEHDLLTSGTEYLVTEASGTPTRMRLISGLYDPARDAEHYYELASLKLNFDAVRFFPVVSPTTALRPAG
ncbi:erythromycin esterase family protein [Kineosporia rhizophila]|uniref:erythromycin esterase family protein n=1 Tax=Kineosporia TaxID=49184 RepID=UPI001E43CF20|nr:MULTISPECIES: erythromycin esterase family protein [Kineosporia]MCE0538193.1 erythromycin esterase family protein [Kineosporia rhizophila]GLY15027.1 hypothetical protein Kisp01_20420 [Kineosporia sp. NBRC 101677]